MTSDSMCRRNLIERYTAAGITVEDVIEYDIGFRRTMDEMLQNHIRECDDYFCGEEWNASA